MFQSGTHLKNHGSIKEKDPKKLHSHASSSLSLLSVDAHFSQFSATCNGQKFFQLSISLVSLYIFFVMPQEKPLNFISFLKNSPVVLPLISPAILPFFFFLEQSNGSHFSLFSLNLVPPLAISRVTRSTISFGLSLLVISRIVQQLS